MQFFLYNTTIHSAWSESSAHARDGEAAIERAKKWGPGHLQRSKGEAMPKGCFGYRRFAVPCQTGHKAQNF